MVSSWRCAATHALRAASVPADAARSTQAVRCLVLLRHMKSTVADDWRMPGSDACTLSPAVAASTKPAAASGRDILRPIDQREHTAARRRPAGTVAGIAPAERDAPTTLWLGSVCGVSQGTSQNTNIMERGSVRPGGEDCVGRSDDSCGNIMRTPWSVRSRPWPDPVHSVEG